VKTEHALAATLPFLDVPRADVAVLRGEIERWTPLPDVAGAPSLATALRPHLRLYILGLLAARMEDNEHAEQYARQLERLSAPAQGHGITAALAATIRADVALHARRYAEVLTLLVPVNGEVPLELVSVRPFVNTREFTQEHARYLRAEALLALGRNDEARRWLEYGFQGSPWELAYLAPVHDRLARILASSGDRQGSATHLKAFAKLWRDSDAPQLARVKAALDSVR
jgi:tetratricopeptide (TPR) repeat protein